MQQIKEECRKLTLPAFFRQNSQSFIFVFFHDFPFSGAFIVDAAQVEDAMDDGAVEFFVVGCFKLFRICFYRIQADEKIARYLVATGIIECDDVGVIIVLQVLAVYFQDLVVGTKDIADIPCLFSATALIQLLTALFLMFGSSMSSA